MTDNLTLPCSMTLSELQFSDGQSYKTSDSDIVILVGPNNAGKSLALREINLHLTKPNKFLCITGIKKRRKGTAAELIKFFEEHVPQAPNTRAYIYGSASVHDGFIGQFGTTTDTNIGTLFVNYVGAETRLSACAAPNSIDIGRQPKTHALQFLYDSDTITNEINDHFKTTFGQNIGIDYRGGSTIPAYIGDIPKIEKGEDRTSESYVTKLRKLPRLEEQGDGIRSFAGLVFETLVLPKSITLIDEPEAFLHPPQMRRLGYILGKNVSGQLFVATHSSNILRGFIDSEHPSLRVIRLQRDGNLNITKEAEPKKIRALWDSPELKYSNALEAIFHERCILTEADSDCRFYNLLSDYIEENSDAEKWPDTLYVPCGGKASMAKLGSIIRGLGVPTLMVFDIDILSDENDIKNAIESMDGDWENYRKDWNIVNSAITSKIKVSTPDEIRESIRTLLSETKGARLPKSKIQSLLRSAKPWQEVKKKGISQIPKGQATKAVRQLCSELSKIGIFIVPVGEIEGFVPVVGGHGPKFVSTVLNEYKPDDDELKTAREFVKSFYVPLEE